MGERRFLILHGYTGSGPEHWQTWLSERLRDRGEEVAYPQLPDPNRPRLEAWLAVLADELEQAGDRSLVVLCHSAGCNLWLHDAVRRRAQAAERVLLVAPPGPRWHEPAVEGFTPLPLDPETAATAAGSTRIVASTTDPHCAAEEARAYADALGVEFDLLPDADHLNTAAGYGPWPSVEEWSLRGTVPVRGNG